MKKDVYIINAPDNVNFEFDTGVWPPLGSLRVALETMKHGVNAYFIDGQHYTSLDEVLSKVKPEADLVGITFNRVTIPTVKPLIKGLLEKGVKKIVAGGQAIIPIADMFVRYFSDSRIMASYGDGEPTISGLVNNSILSGIPNLIYFDGKNVQKTLEQLIDYSKLEVLRYSKIEGFDWKSYFKVSHNVFNDDKNRASVYFADGCPNRIKEGCSFCARRKTGVIRTFSAENAYEQLIYLKSQGADNITVESDTFFSNYKFLKELSTLMKVNGKLGLELDVYGSVNELNERNLDLAYELGVKSILVGVESGNSKIREINGKYFSNERVFKTAEDCREREIIYDPAFVLGMIGETNETAIETVGLAKQLVSKGFSGKVYASLFMPFPGSPAYDLIKNQLNLDSKFSEKYGDEFSRWDYNWSKLIDAQVEIMTNTSREHLFSCLESMKNIDKKVNPVIGDYSND